MQNNSERPKIKTNKKNWIKIAIPSGLFLVLIIFLFACLYMYQNPNKFFFAKSGISHKIMGAAIQNLPFPIAATDIQYYDWKNPQGIFAFRFIAIRDWEKNFNALKKYYETQGTDFNSTDGEQQLNELKSAVLEKMITDKIVLDLAKEKNILITDQDIQEEWQRAIEAFGDEDQLKKAAEEMYGWSPDEFKQNVIIPYIYQRKLLNTVFDSSQDDAQSKQKAEEVLSKLKNSNVGFEDLAREYSEDPSTRDQGGDLGTFSKGTMVPAFEEAAFSLEKGQISDLVKTDYGYHIIKVEDKGMLEDGKEQVHARHILIRTTDPGEWFQKWIENQKQNMKIYKFINF